MERLSAILPIGVIEKKRFLYPYDYLFRIVFLQFKYLVTSMIADSYRGTSEDVRSNSMNTDALYTVRANTKHGEFFFSNFDTL